VQHPQDVANGRVTVGLVQPTTECTNLLTRPVRAEQQLLYAQGRLLRPVFLLDAVASTRLTQMFTQ